MSDNLSDLDLGPMPDGHIKDEFAGALTAAPGECPAHAHANTGNGEPDTLKDLINLPESDNAEFGGSSRGGHGAGRGGHTGRGGGRAGTTRGAKNRRPQRPNKENDEYNSEIEDKAIVKRQKPDPSAGEAQNPPPGELHRRRTSLRSRLIQGNYDPQPIGMRAYQMNQATFNSPDNVPTQGAVPGQPQPAARGHASRNGITVNIRPMAYRSTPLAQLYFPVTLFARLTNLDTAFNRHNNPDGHTFAVIRLVGGVVADLTLHLTLREANARALSVMTTEHPEVFRIPNPAEPPQSVVPAANAILFVEDPTFGGAARDVACQPDPNDPGSRGALTYIFAGTSETPLNRIHLRASRPDDTVVDVSVHRGLYCAPA